MNFGAYIVEFMTNNFHGKSSSRGVSKCQGHLINFILEIWVNCLLTHLLNTTGLVFH